MVKLMCRQPGLIRLGRPLVHLRGALALPQATCKHTPEELTAILA